MIFISKIFFKNICYFWQGFHRYGSSQHGKKQSEQKKTTTAWKLIILVIIINKNWNPPFNKVVLLDGLRADSCVVTVILVDNDPNHGRTADALRYVLPPIKNWWPFCSEQLQRQIIYQNARIFKRNWLIPSPPAIYI